VNDIGDDRPDEKWPSEQWLAARDEWLARNAPVTRLDRVVQWVFDVSACVSWLGLLAASVLAVTGHFRPVGWLLLPFYVLVDVGSLYMWVSYLKRGRGPSGMGVVSWLYYAMFSMFGTRLSDPGRMGLLVGLTFFHAVCHGMILRKLAKRWLVGPSHPPSSKPGTGA